MYNVSEACLSAFKEFQTPNLVWDSELSLTLVETYLSNEINSIISNSENYGFSCITKKTLSKFLQKVENSYILYTKDLDETTKELYLLYQICNGLYAYQDNYLNVSYEKFRSRILFPNLMYILIRYYHKAQGFIQATIRKIYNEQKNKNSGIIQKFTNSYYLDEQIIKSDVLYQFLGNVFRKYNPLNIDDINLFYRKTIRNIFYYYFKLELSNDSTYSDFSDIDFSLGKNINIPVRLLYYRDIMYDLQIKKLCNSSNTLRQLSYNYNIFKNIIINNEFQDMFYSLNQDSFMLKNNQYKLLNLYKNENVEFLEKLRELPLIYKLLRCIHIVNPKVRPYNEWDIKPSNIKQLILEELSHPFKNLFSENYIYTILERTSSNFVDNILCGEYINPITFSTVKINDYSFTTQLKQFVKLCLEESGVSNG